MNAELENTLLALSLTEKIEIYMYHMPFVTPDFNEEAISPRLLVELERRHREIHANPEIGLSFEDCKGHRSHCAHS